MATGSTDFEIVGKVKKLHGDAWVESSAMLVQADDMDWNQETGDVHASGKVHVHDFKTSEELWCDRLEYNTDTEKGVFYKVKGRYMPRIVPRQGGSPARALSTSKESGPNGTATCIRFTTGSFRTVNRR